MNQTWDAGGDASAALLHVVDGFGPPVLGRPDMLEGLLADDVPQLPREIAMLTAAAKYGVADLLAERVRQGVAPQAAIAMVANDMTSRTAVDAAGAQWAASVFARATGLTAGGPPVTAVAGDAGATIPPPGAGPPAAGPRPAEPTRIMTGGNPAGAGSFPPGPTTPGLTPADRTLLDGPAPTRGLEGGPEIYAPPAAPDQQTILPGQPGFPGYPGQPAPGQPAPGQPAPGRPDPGQYYEGERYDERPYPGQPTKPPGGYGGQPTAVANSPGFPSPWAAQVATAGSGALATGSSQGLAVTAAVCFGIAAIMQPFVGLGTHVIHMVYVLDWVTAIAELLVFGGAAIWVGQTKGSAAGFALTLGIAVPAIPVGIYTALILPNSGEPGSQHSILLLTTIVWLLASIAAAFIGFAGLAQQRQLTRAVPSGPATAVGVIGVLYALANIVDQAKFRSDPSVQLGIFGAGVHGVEIFWGLVLIALFSAPPLMAGFWLPNRPAAIGLITGWLLVTFIWQVGDSPVADLIAAPGLYLTWIVWLATLLATAVLVTRPQPEAVNLGG